MLHYFIFLLNAVFFGTFYANLMQQSIDYTGKNLYQALFAIVISSLKNDVIFNVYLPMICDFLHLSNPVVFQILFVCAHCVIINRAGIVSISYFIFHIEHITVLSFFVIGNNNLKQILLYFSNFMIIHFFHSIRNKKLI